MLMYPAKIVPDGDAWLVTFRDIPEAITSGETAEQAAEMAADALLTAMDFYFEDQRPVPMPSKPRKGEVTVALPVSTSSKVLLLNEMLRQRIRPATLAKRLGTTPQEVNRIIDLHHSTKIDTVAAALSTLGRRLELRLA
jgi:antitoxin HicB